MPICDKIGFSVLIVVSLFFGLVTMGGGHVDASGYWETLKAIALITGIIWVPLRLIDFIAGGPVRRKGSWTITVR